MNASSEIKTICFFKKNDYVTVKERKIETIIETKYLSLKLKTKEKLEKLFRADITFHKLIYFYICYKSFTI